MPVVAQINVNFANLQEVRNVDEFDIASGGDFQIEDKCINPNILSKYCLYNREYGDAGDYGLSDVDYLRYIGGYISAGNKVNVKHSDFHVRNNLHVGDNLYAEFIYSRFLNKTDADYQDERAKNPRSITLSPKIEDKLTTYLTIQTTDANTRFIDLHAQRSTTPNKIRIDSNATTDKIEVISPIVNLFKDGATNGVVNINSFLNVANDTKINTNKFVVTASDGKTQIAGNLNVGSDTTYSKFTVDSSNGNTVVEGTLAVTGNTTLKNNVIFQGGTSETFVINNGTTGQNKFTVDSPTGNTVVEGTLSVTGTVVIKDSLTLEGGTSQSFIINTGPSGTNKFTVDSTNGNTDIQGTLNIKGNTLINADKFVVTASDGKTQIAGDLNIGSTTTGAGAYGKFTVASSSGNTDIDGTLDVAGKLTAENITNSIKVKSIVTASTELTTSNYNVLNIKDFVTYTFTKGMIMLWSGTSAGVPQFWRLCNGAAAVNGVTIPDLSNKFIIASNTYSSGQWKSSVGTHSSVSTGGVSDVTLTTNQIPTFTPSILTQTSEGGHKHTFTFNSLKHGHGNTEYVTSLNRFPGGGGSGFDHEHIAQHDNPNKSKIAEADITPSIALNGQSTEGAHTHTFTFNSIGGGLSHDNIPPFYALAYIIYVGPA